MHITQNLENNFPEDFSTQNKIKVENAKFANCPYLYTIPWSNVITVFCILNQNLHFQRKINS